MGLGDNLYKDPDKFIEISNLGDIYIQSFYNKYAGLRMLQNMHLFERAYELLNKGKHYSRETAFGEMHTDGYLWIEKCEDVRVIVEERQSYRHIFISYSGYFHIRALAHDYNYPEIRKKEFKDITIDKFRKQGFRSTTNNKFSAFAYGDDRDDGYILSMSYMEAYKHIPASIDVSYADRKTLFAINSLKYWEYYLDNPEKVE